jgi:hypothetical protein
VAWLFRAWEGGGQLWNSAGHGVVGATGLIVLIDDVRYFADDRPCLTFRSSGEAVTGLSDLAEGGVEITEMWLDYDLGGGDDVQPVPHLLDLLDQSGRRLKINKTYVITSSSMGAHQIRRTLDRLGYRQKRLYSLRGKLTW